MLPAKYRLKDRKTFNEVFKSGKTISNEVLVIKSKAIAEKEIKIGFSAGLKFSKKSSQRNKVKRWMREAVRNILRKIKPGYNLLFLINSKCPYKELSQDIIRNNVEILLIKAKILQ
ncbi:MAG: ribonuclease P protein component [Parcubacteria group bacterium]|jgi:ribonuclease P protein component